MFQVNKLFSSRLYINLALGLIISAIALIVMANPAHATTFTVAAGNDENTDNASCSLSEAIENINDQATTNTDCSPTGAYGTDDTINLPAGTITLTADLPYITESATITGQGMGPTTIDGDGQWTAIGFSAPGLVDASVTDLEVTNYAGNAVSSLNSNLNVERVSIDGAGSIEDLNNILGGVFFRVTDGSSKSFTVNNVYVHDLTSTTQDAALFGIGVGSGGGSNAEINIQNSTVTRLSVPVTGTQSHGIGIASGIFDSFSAGNVNAVLNNITISEMSSISTASTLGLSVINGVNGASSQSVVNVNNSTISSVQAPEHDLFSGVYGSAFNISAAAAQPGDELDISVDLTNTVLSNDIGVPSQACSVADFSALIGSGSPNVTFSSQGGNLSDDTSCSSYFTQPTDQNNVVGLAATFGALGDYGGYVPTIPLLEGSPAIDAGVTVAGLASDARGVSRPLGVAYDSGAYESPFTKTTESVDTLADTGGSVRMLLVTVSILLVGSMLATWQKRVLQ